ncbi:hypothetical protein FDH01_gp220 [Acinetobacter phage vB_AbaM_ME3]|uniref:Uncharacterized protein n=1 Tax=Acinetobacter phage vB_AbaM_ME3 TaxID=1837876 RepID=A0A172Q0N1_9CAUD|nr:hypothetical protein FDH01_gp220 [Acinetobacter phage vB_AbaM_ME3]AND75402.1 hypothetical protein ME3_241 [Acinetobacter phage vB_AbaM_ME3]
MMDDITTIGFPFFYPPSKKKGTFLKFKKIVRDDPLWAKEIQELLATMTEIGSVSCLPPTDARLFNEYYVREESRTRLRNSRVIPSDFSEYGRVPNLTTGRTREQIFRDLLED